MTWLVYTHVSPIYRSFSIPIPLHSLRRVLSFAFAFALSAPNRNQLTNEQAFKGLQCITADVSSQKRTMCGNGKYTPSIFYTCREINIKQFTHTLYTHTNTI